MIRMKGSCPLNQHGNNHILRSEPMETHESKMDLKKKLSRGWEKLSVATCNRDGF